MATKLASYLNRFDQIHLFSEWKNLIGEESFSGLQAHEILKTVPLENLRSYQHTMNLGEGLDWYEISEIDGIPHFVPSDLSHEPVKISDHVEIKFAKLDWESYLQKIRTQNNISVSLHSLQLPDGVAYLGGKVVGQSKIIHFIGKLSVGENDIEILRRFCLNCAKGDLNFIFLTQNPEILQCNLDSFSKNISIGSLPTLVNTFKIEERLIFRSEFGYTLDEVMAQAEFNTLVLDLASGQIGFCKKIIWNKSGTDLFKLVSYLAQRPNKNISTDEIAHTVLNKETYTKSSKIISDLKYNFFAQVEEAFGKSSEAYNLAKEMIPKKEQKERGFISLSTKNIVLVVLNPK